MRITASIGGIVRPHPKGSGNRRVMSKRKEFWLLALCYFILILVSYCIAFTLVKYRG